MYDEDRIHVTNFAFNVKMRRYAKAGHITGGQVEVTMIEIYNERVKDLLNPANPGNLSARGGGRA
jgi:hypothetical protein